MRQISLYLSDLEMNWTSNFLVRSDKLVIVLQLLLAPVSTVVNPIDHDIAMVRAGAFHTFQFNLHVLVSSNHLGWFSEPVPWPDTNQTMTPISPWPCNISPTCSLSCASLFLHPSLCAPLQQSRNCVPSILQSLPLRICPSSNLEFLFVPTNCAKPNFMQLYFPPKSLHISDLCLLPSLLSAQICLKYLSLGLVSSPSFHSSTCTWKRTTYWAET